MPLTFNLRHLEKKDLDLTGDLPAKELDAEGIDELVTIHQPVQYDLTVERLGEDILVQGRLRATLDCECSRCLKSFQQKVELDPWSVDLPLSGEDKVKVENDLVDLTPLIREDILLAFPQHPLCESECSGLPKAPQKPAQRGGGVNVSKALPSPWVELDKLKF